MPENTNMRLILLITFLFILGGCVNYNQLSFTPAELFPNKRFEKNINRYKIIVHDSDRVAVLTNPVIQDNSLKGELRYIDKDSVVEHPVTKEAILKHRSDVHVYLNGEQDYELPEFRNGRKEVKVRLENVDQITAYSSNEKDIIGTIFLIIGAVVLVFVALIVIMVLLFTLLIYAFTEAFSSASSGSNSSGSNSGGSNSGGSNSGGSNSGGSNSGGSGNSSSGGSSGSGSGGGSGSGCYIATMAYGDYDHPQVLLLREFRDKVLLQSARGRAFVRFYYTYSPKVVEKTKSWNVFHRLIRMILNMWIKWLQKGKHI